MKSHWPFYAFMILSCGFSYILALSLPWFKANALIAILLFYVFAQIAVDLKLTKWFFPMVGLVVIGTISGFINGFIDTTKSMWFYIVFGLPLCVIKISTHTWGYHVLPKGDVHTKSSAVRKYYVALSIIQWPFFITQALVIHPIGTAENYYDFWAGTFPYSADYTMAWFLNMVILTEELRRPTSRIFDKSRILQASNALLILLANSSVNKLILAVITAFILARIILGSKTYLENKIKPWPFISVCLIAIIAASIFQKEILGLLSQASRTGDSYGFLLGYENDRASALYYIFNGEWTWFGNGAGIFTYDYAQQGSGLQIKGTANSRGLWFSVLYEVGILGSLLLFTSLAIALKNAPTILMVAVFLLTLSQETVRDCNLLAVTLAFYEILKRSPPSPPGIPCNQT